MKLASVNIGKLEPFSTKSGQTGIFKHPQQGAVRVTTLGLEADRIADTKNHGGPDQAVYVYGVPDYDWWTEELGDHLPPGIFGENLTVSGFESAKACVGDRLLIGDVVLEVTSPRIPCVTLAARMGHPDFVKRFLKANRPGVYCRVIAPGQIAEDMEVDYQPFDEPQIPVIDMVVGHKNPSDEIMRQYLKAPIHHKLREDYEAKLAG